MPINKLEPGCVTLNRFNPSPNEKKKKMDHSKLKKFVANRINVT